MALTQASGLRAEPFECKSCGRAVSLPMRHEALLDERGWAQVPCACGALHMIPFEAVELEPPKTFRRPSWQVAALWIVIIALIVLLLPAVQVVREPEPEPPSYLTT